MFCPNCGVSNTVDARFCKDCGTGMNASQSLDGFTVPDPFSEGIFQAEAKKADALIGRIIDNRYHLEERIGVGGMGAVYRASRLMIGDEVAIKILHPERMAAGQSFERFRREAQTAARLKHPNAVSIYDFGVTQDGLQYLVMELVEGQSLRQIIKQRGALAPTDAAEIITQICAALDEAHRRNVVHRDIKPDNIIVHTTAGGLRVKVLDFGIAKLRDDKASHLTQTGSVMGTPHYMSPEQCIGEELDSRADIYSLGIVLYEMLCGVVPFNAPVSTAVVIQHVNQPPPPMREKNVSITPAVEAVVRKALGKQRGARQQTAGALAQELTGAVYGSGVIKPQVVPVLLTSTKQLNQNPEDLFQSDETTVVQDAAKATPSTGSVTGGMAQTVHLAIAPSSNGLGTLAPVTPIPGGNYTAPKRESNLSLILVSALLAIVVAGGVIGAGTWMMRGRPGESETRQTTKGDSEQAKTKPDKSNAPTPPTGMVYVPGGEFLMGSDSGDEFEQPLHKVIVKPFFMDVYEVTCEEYKKFIDATGHRIPSGWVNGDYQPGAARRPVTGVNWDDATAYARWAGKRLPTEEEWEFAARGTDGRTYPWGNDWQDGYANAGNLNKGMVDVGTYKGASPFGAFDMIGNAWEWTSSDIKAYPGGKMPQTGKPDSKVIRGGFWGSSVDKKKATVTFRGWWGARDESDYSNTGFRCVKDAP